MIRRINFYSGPCCGKSVMAASTFTELKKRNINVELIQEYAKDLAYEGRKIQPYHQLQIFTEQVTREYRVLQSSPEVVVISDSPILLNIPYAIRYGFTSWRSLVSIAKDFELSYPSINFFINREDCPYAQVGRYEKLDEAIGMDMAIEQFLKENQVPYVSIGYKEHERVVKMMEHYISLS
jgi:hypothetical protein